MKFIILRTALSALIFTTPLFSQGEYSERGQDVIGIEGYYNASKSYSAVGGSAGYSLSGIVDLGSSFGQVFFKDKLGGKDVSAIELSPTIGLHIIKQSERLPVSLAVFVSYFYHLYTSEALAIRDITMSEHGISAGGSLYCIINPSQSLKIRPSMGIRYSSNKLEASDAAGNSFLLTEAGAYFHLGIAFYGEVAQSTVFMIGPAVYLHTDYATFGINAGFATTIQDE